VWIGVHFGTWMHVAIGACIAPFLVLRTEASRSHALRLVTEWLERQDRNMGSLVVSDCSSNVKQERTCFSRLRFPSLFAIRYSQFPSP
jgi:hypothetical protein